MPRRSAKQWWYVYLVRCADDTLYCGVTNDLSGRVTAHNGGRGAKYTRSRLPVVLVWSKRCGGKSRALQLEYALKQWPRAQKLQLVAGSATLRWGRKPL